MGLRQKLSLGFGGLLLIILIIGGQSIVQLHELGQSIDVILRENYQSVVACQEMKEALERMDSGMLFVYDHPERYGFWMKGMRFPLDYIWINGNKVADLSRNIPQPASDTATPVTLAPSIPVDKVLEVNAGIIDRFDIKVGDLVQLSN